MASSSTNKFAGNEKSIEDLTRDTMVWKESLFQASEEMQFLSNFLVADIFEGSQPNLYEKLQLFTNRLEELEKEMFDLNLLLHNHTYDIEGMLECDDISCDTFYYGQHHQLGNRILSYLKDFDSLKLDIFRFTGKLLRKSRKTEK